VISSISISAESTIHVLAPQDLCGARRCPSPPSGTHLSHFCHFHQCEQVAQQAHPALQATVPTYLPTYLHCLEGGTSKASVLYQSTTQHGFVCHSASTTGQSALYNTNDYDHDYESGDVANENNTDTDINI
jgi:hypothetical protein